MRRRTLFSLLAVSILAPTSFGRTQDSQTSSPAELSAQSEARRKALLARAESGDKGAQMWLGAYYEQGLFGKVDFQEALRWFRKSAAQGDPDAQVGLGQMYEDGEGVKQNYLVAAKWYRKAAEHVPDFGGAGQGRSALVSCTYRVGSSKRLCSGVHVVQFGWLSGKSPLRQG